MSSRKSTSSRRSGSTTAPSAETTDRSSSTTNRSSSTHAHRTPEEKLASAVRSVVRHNGPEAAENIFNQALDQSGHSRSGRSGTSHTESDGRSGGHRSSSSAHPSTASSRSSVRSGSEHTRSSRDSATSSHSTRSSSSSHRSSSSARSSSTADSTSTYTPSNYLRDGRSSTSSRYPAGQRDSAGSESYVESIPEDDESAEQPEEGYDQLMLAPAPYGAPLGDLAGIRAGHNLRPAAHTVASVEGGTDARGNTYNILNVVNIYDHRPPPPPAFGLWIAPPLPGWRCSCCPAGPDGVYRGCLRHG